MSIAIIGAGASGLMAALQGAWLGAEVTLFERNPAAGRKLLVTGSGRCNLSNDTAVGNKYTCADPGWMDLMLSRFGVNDLLDTLGEIGVPVTKTGDGWYYPLSDSAHSVVDAFESALRLAGVRLCMETQVLTVKPKAEGFLVQYLTAGKKQEKVFNRVIVSAGGMAYPTLGSRGELFPVLKELGHTIIPKRPALAPVLVDLGNLKPLQGIRLDVGVTLRQGSQKLASSLGNLIFTQWGLNGPAVMDISHHVSARPKEDLVLSLNMLAFYQEAFDQLMAKKRCSQMPLYVFLGAFFPPKVTQLMIKNNHLSQDIPMNQVGDLLLKQLVESLKKIDLSVTGVRGFEYCQVSAGGVPVGEVNSQTLESRKIKGLFLTGETLDVVGPCGGYNLQYAFSSGALAGKAAAL